jgi:predicted alpha/beta superfamily hydrolase
MIVKRDFIYPPKNASRPLHIWLPDDYDRTDDRYPVLYFFEGHNLFLDEDATYGKSWGMKEFLEGWSKPMIVVGIECGHDGYERLSEYMPYPSEGWFGQFEPCGEITMDWIVGEIKPMIDREYRTIPFRECTAIGGSSMGGIMALYAAIHYNNWFSKAACVSSAMGFCMKPLMADIKANPVSPDTRIFLSWGTHEAYGLEKKDREDRSSRTYQWNKQTSDAILARGGRTRMYCQVGGGHCEADWEKLLPTMLPWLWQD